MCTSLSHKYLWKIKEVFTQVLYYIFERLSTLASGRVYLYLIPLSKCICSQVSRLFSVRPKTSMNTFGHINHPRNMYDIIHNAVWYSHLPGHIRIYVSKQVPGNFVRRHKYETDKRMGEGVKNGRYKIIHSYANWCRAELVRSSLCKCFCTRNFSVRVTSIITITLMCVKLTKHRASTTFRRLFAQPL